MLVIIGLIVGGVLVGQDLISAAATRAQISQIEKYNTAVNTFRIKYGYLPGDIPDPYASNFGFQARGIVAGEGDGNGVLDSVNWTGGGNGGVPGAIGETAMFWVDLSTAKLIDGSFNSASPMNPPATEITGTLINTFLPQAKIGNGNYVYVFGVGTWQGPNWEDLGPNYFGVSAVNNAGGPCCAAQFTSTPGMTVAQAFSIDKKIDDGLPQSGRVTAFYIDKKIDDGLPQSGRVTAFYISVMSGSDYIWSNGGSAFSTPTPFPTPWIMTAPTASTCYDNGGNIQNTFQYSMSQSNGSGVNCALSFQMQGAGR